MLKVANDFQGLRYFNPDVNVLPSLTWTREVVLELIRTAQLRLETASMATPLRALRLGFTFGKLTQIAGILKTPLPPFPLIADPPDVNLEMCDTRNRTRRDADSRRAISRSQFDAPSHLHRNGPPRRGSRIDLMIGGILYGRIGTARSI
jgi:hypothetical protein